MKFNSLARLLLLSGCACVATQLVAQSAPVPPIQGPLSPVLATTPTESSVTPDEHLLSGGQILGIGTWGSRHSFLTPSLRVSEILDSNPLLLNSTNGNYKGLTGFEGSVQWMQYFGRATEIRYFGAMRYDARSQLQGYGPLTNVHRVAFSKNMQFRTWSLLIDDEAQYSQGSTFAASGMEGMGSIVTLAGQMDNQSNQQLTSNSLRPDFLPDQSILTGRVGRITNTALIELDGHLGARDTATLAASYGLLHFNSSLLEDTDQVSVVAGYNRKMSARGSIAIESALTRFNYQRSGSSVSSEYLSVLYARRISGRSSIEFGAGPQVAQTNLSDAYIGWQARGSVVYRTRRVNLGARAMRTVTGGAGVLSGVISNIGQGTLDSTLSRYWSASLASGVSHNQQLNSPQKYDVQFVDFSLNRRIGRYTNLFLSYDVQHQTAAPVCTGLNCGFVGLRNVFGIGLAWNYRPLSVF